jgi:L-alanine-DL-glutamate epimerase-like enolase superfamily enzyme
MKIVDVKTYIVGNPPPHRGGLNWIFLKLVTDEGLEGWGECNAPRLRERTIVQLIQELSTRFVIGEDPFNIEKIWEGLYKSSQRHTAHFFQHPGTLTGQVIAAYEMACWDIVGKALNQPVYRLLGGVKNKKIRFPRSLEKSPSRSSAMLRRCSKTFETRSVMTVISVVEPMDNTTPMLPFG